jgi:hypothetical protein
MEQTDIEILMNDVRLSLFQILVEMYNEVKRQEAVTNLYAEALSIGYR